MGTTLVALLAQEGRAALAHVGDSRAIRSRERIRQLTDDHSLVGERCGVARSAPTRANTRSATSDACGRRARVVEPDLAELSPDANDVFVLCSDGPPATCVTKRSPRRCGGVDPQEAIDALIRPRTRAAATTTSPSWSCAASERRPE
jgi:serine/threonine protein phosphatase PrpC